MVDVLEDSGPAGESDRHNAEPEDAPAQQMQAHVILYEPSEAAGLRDAGAGRLFQTQRFSETRRMSG